MRFVSVAFVVTSSTSCADLRLRTLSAPVAPTQKPSWSALIKLLDFAERTTTPKAPVQRHEGALPQPQRKVRVASLIFGTTALADTHLRAAVPQRVKVSSVQSHTSAPLPVREVAQLNEVSLISLNSLKRPGTADEKYQVTYAIRYTPRLNPSSLSRLLVLVSILPSSLSLLSDSVHKALN